MPLKKKTTRVRNSKTVTAAATRIANAGESQAGFQTENHLSTVDVFQMAQAAPQLLRNDLPTLLEAPIDRGPRSLANSFGQNPNFFGGGNIQLPSQGGFPGGGSNQQVEDSTTMFENLRWYLVSNFRQLLSQAYVEIGLIQTIVDVPVDDALRGGVIVKTKQLDEEQTKQLKVAGERDDFVGTAGWACKWERLYGGGGILVLVGDQDPEDELDVDAITEDEDLDFRDVDMWELYWDLQNMDGYDPQIQREPFEYYSYYSESVHKTRVMRLVGRKAPSFIRPRLRGWGVSVVEALVRSVNQYLKATDLGFEVLDEFKLDIFKIKNLVNTLLSPTAAQSVQQTIQQLNWQKNYQHAMVLDSEDEYEQKQLSFAGLAEAMEGIRLQVAADMRMPITKLFGTSMGKGFQTDQNDMENYNSMVQALRDKLKFHLLRMYELKSQQLFGFIPDDLELDFKPLRELSATDEETVKTGKFNRLLSSLEKGAITLEEFREACNVTGLFDIQLDASIDTLQAFDTEEEDADEDGGGEPGEDREDSRNPNIKKKVKTESPTFTMGDHSKGAKKPKDETGPAIYHNTQSVKDARMANPGNVDEAKWSKAKQIYEKAIKRGETLKSKWAFVTAEYEKLGGKFK